MLVSKALVLDFLKVLLVAFNSIVMSLKKLSSLGSMLLVARLPCAFHWLSTKTVDSPRATEVNISYWPPGPSSSMKRASSFSSS